MARPVSIKDETIIAAAREVFLQRGIQATTAEVAQRAGVSEGSVFKRFRSKVDLFRAAMDDQIHEPDWVRDLAGRVGKGDVRENLHAIGVEMVAFYRRLMPLLMMSWSNPAPSGFPCGLAGPNPPPVRALARLVGYFDAEMRAGRLRAHDPQIVARAFAGSINHFVFFELLQLQHEGGEPALAAEAYVHGLVGLLWGGIEPRARRSDRVPAPPPATIDVLSSPPLGVESGVS